MFEAPTGEDYRSTSRCHLLMRGWGVAKANTWSETRLGQECRWAVLRTPQKGPRRVKHNGKKEGSNKTPQTFRQSGLQG